MSVRSTQIYTICGCIDHCFGFAMWCEDFAKHVVPEDMMWGLDRSFEILSDATRLHSFLALRKMDDFLRAKSRKDDLVAADLGIDPAGVLGAADATFLSAHERENVSKGVAHLTEQLTLDPDSEVDLDAILKRSIPAFSRLVVEMRKADKDKEAEYWLSKTEELIKRAQELRFRRRFKTCSLGTSALPPGSTRWAHRASRLRYYAYRTVCLSSRVTIPRANSALLAGDRCLSLQNGDFLLSQLL